MANRLTVKAGGLLAYRYDVSKDIGFKFNTLAEVGAPYQQWFRDEIAKRGWVVEFGRNLDEPPYVGDFLLATKTTINEEEE